jgi:hypothetical protein
MGLGSGIRKKPIPDPGSRGQKGTGSRLRNTNRHQHKCHLKILTCKGTLRHVFIKIERLEIQSVMLVFSTQLWELLRL